MVKQTLSVFLILVKVTAGGWPICHQKDLQKVAPWNLQTFYHFSCGVQLLELVDKGPWEMP